jgi:hypothetical protein
MRSIDLLLYIFFSFFSLSIGRAAGAWKALCASEHWKSEQWGQQGEWKVEK